MNCEAPNDKAPAAETLTILLGNYITRKLYIAFNTVFDFVDFIGLYIL